MLAAFRPRGFSLRWPGSGQYAVSEPAYTFEGRCDYRADFLFLLWHRAIYGFLNPTAVNIQTIVLGNILAIAPEDILQLAIIGFTSLLILLIKWKDLMVTFFDENHARSVGLNPTRLKLLFFTLLATCTIAALQTVGAFW